MSKTNDQKQSSDGEVGSIGRPMSTPTEQAIQNLRNVVENCEVSDSLEEYSVLAICGKIVEGKEYCRRLTNQKAIDQKKVELYEDIEKIIRAYLLLRRAED